MKSNVIELKVRFSETDAMGVVHHGNFYSWFEVARYKLAEDFFPLSCNKLKFGDIYMPVITCGCRYRKFIKFGDTVSIKTYIIRNDTAKIRFYYEVTINEENKTAAEGYSEHVCLNCDYKLMLSLPECIKTDLKNFAENYPEYMKEDNIIKRFVH